jgi:hypothetical protein
MNKEDRGRMKPDKGYDSVSPSFFLFSFIWIWDKFKIGETGVADCLCTL